MKATIAVDIDDVLSASAEGFAEYSNKRWGSGITAEDYVEDWSVPWNVSHGEASARAVEYHASGVLGEYRNLEDALPVLKKLSKRYRLIVITSRRLTVKPETDAWLERHFPGIFVQVRYAGMWDKEEGNVVSRLAITKTEICRELGAEYLIDDQPKHCIDAASSGIKALLFGEYAWNRSHKVSSPGITHVRNWADVARYFDV